MHAVSLKSFKSWILSSIIHICVHSAQAMFAGVPLPQRLLLWGQTWWAPSGNTINDIHDHSGAKQLGVKVEMDWFSCRTSPQLGLDLSSGTSHTISVHVFLKTQEPNIHLRSLEWSMNIIKPNMPGGLHPQVTFSGEGAPKTDQIFGSDKKPYKCTGSEWCL